MLWALGATGARDRTQGKGLPRIRCLRALVILKEIQDELRFQWGIERPNETQVQRCRRLGRQQLGQPGSAQRGGKSVSYGTR